MSTTREQRTVSSAMWAAYGDALGFPTELATSQRVIERLGVPEVQYPVPWKRLVGGQFGAHVDLPAGAYSDDTQLRMSVSRCLRNDRVFDVETFSKVELPVWLCYALGAGKGSKVGANALGYRTTAWFSNFFSQKDAEYLRGGGNGAAMRIQPHVWAARDLGLASTYIPDVVKNSVCTHGHARGIAGAAIHALSLAHTLRDGVVPEPESWASLASHAASATLEAIGGDHELTSFWLPVWEERSGQTFRSALLEIEREWKADVALCNRHLSGSSPDAYGLILRELQGLTPEQRGSGLKSALFALLLSWLHRDSSPDIALRASANLLSSDTDTISSMAGALLGARGSAAPTHESVQDAGLIASEGARLCRVAEGRETRPSFAYPDLLKWTAPKSQLDCVGLVDERFALAGIGWLVPLREPYKSGKDDTKWQWFELEFGQTVLCKVRAKPQTLSKAAFPAAVKALEKYVKPPHYSPPPRPPKGVDTRSLFPLEEEQVSLSVPVKETAPRVPSRSVDELTDEAIRSNFDPTVIGEHILDIASRTGSVDLVVAYTAIVVKARSARLRRNRSE